MSVTRTPCDARGVFVTFEGPEGGGKSTQIRRLAARLGEMGLDVVTTREPGGTRLGESVRGLLQHDAAGETPCERAEPLLFCASRAQLVARVVEPALARGAWVLSDRFTDSTVAYQGYGRGLPVETLKALNAFATAGRVPDLTFVLDVPAEVGLGRMAARDEGPDRFEREDAGFHARMRKGFLDLAREEPSRCVVVDASRDPDEVFDDLWSILSSRFAPRLHAPRGECPP
ncbi:MAG: dTMP kinase [Kiritimatiellia bacterium]|jgi:dTMP kinase